MLLIYITMVLKKKKIVLEENRDDQLYINYMQHVIKTELFATITQINAWSIHKISLHKYRLRTWALVTKPKKSCITLRIISTFEYWIISQLKRFPKGPSALCRDTNMKCVLVIIYFKFFPLLEFFFNLLTPLTQWSFHLKTIIPSVCCQDSDDGEKFS